jgi:ATP-dependent DNA helicase RecG
MAWYEDTKPYIAKGPSGFGVRSILEWVRSKGILTAEDLLYHLPFRYEDRQNPRSLDELKPGEMASVIAEVRGTSAAAHPRMPIFEMTVGQGNLAMKCVWFNGSYLQGRFHAGQTIALFGKVEPSRSTRNMKMIQPQFELLPGAGDDEETRLLEVGRITPVYESLGGTAAGLALAAQGDLPLLESVRGAVPECLPQAMLERLGLPDPRNRSARAHFPPEGTPQIALMEARTPALRRLIFEELFFLELGLELKRRSRHKQLGIAFATDDKVREAIREVLPFHPTARRNGRWARLSPTCASRTPCAACCKAMSARARPSSRCRRCWWPSKTATRPR